MYVSGTVKKREEKERFEKGKRRKKERSEDRKSLIIINVKDEIKKY